MSHGPAFTQLKHKSSISSVTTSTILQITLLALIVLVILAWVLKIMRERQQFIDDKRNRFQDIAMTPIRDALVLEMAGLDEVSPETVDNILSRPTSQDNVRNHMEELEAVSQERLAEMEHHAEAFKSSSSIAGTTANEESENSSTQEQQQSHTRIQTPNTDDGSTLSSSTIKVKQAPLPNIVGEEDAKNYN